jgi:beta-xylosidase
MVSHACADRLRIFGKRDVMPVKCGHGGHSGHRDLSAAMNQRTSGRLRRAGKLCILLVFTILRSVQASDTRSEAYRNPVLYADYSDPDIIRVGNDFYLIASSFHFVPGIPILHSRDLVHWEIVGHAVSRLKMAPQYDMHDGTRYGGGVWAPSVRFHDGRFYIYFPTPDEGIFVTTAPRMTGPWSTPVAVIEGPGWEDPCPFWDDDGKAYLVHSKLHAGPLILHRMSPDGKMILDNGRVIVQDPVHLPTLEGPKLYKRHGWYYIFAPIGGVGRGSQAVLRSRNIYGPYEYRIVLAQGTTDVNGPHQGGWIEAPDGRSWFVHFSLRGAHGRITYLEPVQWKDDWPVIGALPLDGNTGQPVAEGSLPVTTQGAGTIDVQTSDDFSSRLLSPIWEWNHNPDDTRWSLTARKGYLRLYATPAADLLHARNTLTETMQDESLEFTARIDIQHMVDGERAGISIFDKNASYIAVGQTQNRRMLIFSVRNTDTIGRTIQVKSIQLRGRVIGDTASYLYSLDGGRSFHSFGDAVKLSFSWWKGARPALFSFNTLSVVVSDSAKPGYADFDWVHYRALSEELAGRSDGKQ